MALRIAPPSSNSTSRSNTLTSTSKGAPSAPGLHDTLRTNLSHHPAASSSAPSTQTKASSPLQSTHPLEARLKNWQSTQESLKMNLLRRQFGMGEPVRRGMEMKICREGEWVPHCLGGSVRAGEEILAGKDTEIAWEDVYKSEEDARVGDVQAEIEGRVGIGEV